MQWPSVADLSQRAPLPANYRYELLDRRQVPGLISALQVWYPAIAVGNASCHLREDFYLQRVCLEDTPERDTIVILIKHDDQLAAVFSAERDADSEVLYGRIFAISPLHRGAHLSRSAPLLEEALGRAMGLGMAYGLATLHYPQMQASFERMGWQLVGITPGFDRELVAPGVIKRVYEAVYAKVLVPDDQLLRPKGHSLTPAVRSLFGILYPEGAR